ncbi:MAG: DUF4097 family beta strand repeat-containing protein [Gammaproteobacteria bacterium]|nr:DUF4097 family beta strand repeat-containing protein [Gammaproteobacteria bacterium]
MNARTSPARVVLAMVSSVFACGAHAEHRSFDVSPGSRFVLDADWGQVEVRTGQGAVIEVDVERAEKVLLEFDQDDDTVTVRSETRDKGVFDWFRNKGPAPVFRISVPLRTDLDLTTVGGNVEVGDLEGGVLASTTGGRIVLGEIAGDVESRTAGGSIEVAAASGTVRANTTGGSIRIGRAAGGVEARTTGGSIHIEESGGPVVARTTGGSMELGRVHGSIDARTTGGSIGAAFAGQPGGDSDLRTTGGSIHLAIAEDIALDLDARTIGGRVSVDMPVTNQQMEGKSKLAASVNGGGPGLTLRTTGGSVQVRGM